VLERAQLFFTAIPYLKKDGEKDPGCRGKRTVVQKVALGVLDRMNRMVTGPVSLGILSILLILSQILVGRLWLFFMTNERAPR
jgi:hypothetical protein